MKGGIIVRLIDVVFILLLGFVSASDIVHKTQIKLPKQLVTGIGRTVVEPRPLVVRLYIQPIKEFTEADFQAIKPNLKSIGKKGKLEKNKITQRWVSERYVSYVARTGTSETDFDEELKTLSDLERYIRTQYNERLIPGQKMIIVIIPHPESMVQGLINIFDICRRYNLEYAFKIHEAQKRATEI